MSTVIDSLVSAINNAVKANGNKEITGDILQVVLDNMVGTLTQINGLLNVNQVNSKSDAYDSASTARQAVPDNLKTEGLVIAYKLSSGWIIEQNKDISGTWTADSSWQTLGPVSVSQNTSTGGYKLEVGTEKADIVSQDQFGILGEEQTISKTSNDYDGIFWANEVYAANGTLNGFVFKIYKDYKYKISGTIVNIVPFASKPTIGTTQYIQDFEINANADFVAPADCYVLVSVREADGITIKTYESGIVEASKKVAPLEYEVGGGKEEIELTQDDFCGLFWGGQIYAATASFNGFLLPLTNGRRYEIGSATSAITLGTYPQVGDSSYIRSVEGNFVANLGEKYLLITIPTSTTSFNFIKYPFGLSVLDGIDKKLSLGALLVDAYDGIFWGGQVYAATSRFNGFIVSVPKGQDTLYIKNLTLANGLVSVACFSHFPNIGDTDAMNSEKTISDGNITRVTLPNSNGLYALVTCSVDDVTLSNVKIILATEAFDEAYSGLKGKKILCLGDSITEFMDGDSYNYPAYLSMLSGATVYGCGIGGTRLSQRATPGSTSIDGAYGALDIVSLCEAIKDDDFSVQEAAALYLKNTVEDDNTAQVATLANIDYDSLDYIVIMAGTNDWASDIPIGTDTDSGDYTTIKGAIRKIIGFLYDRCPKVRILLLGETVRYYEQKDRAHWCDVYQNGNGDTLTDVINAIIESAGFSHTPILDLYRKLGWNEFNFDTYFAYAGGVNETHPYSGFKYIAEMVMKYLINNYY